MLLLSTISSIHLRRSIPPAVRVLPRLARAVPLSTFPHPSPSPSRLPHPRFILLMRQRRPSSTKAGEDTKVAPSNGSASPTGANGHNHDHEHNHSHAHGIFHSHSHLHEKGTELVVDALKGKGDAGSRVTLIGLFSNVALTGSKGLAGWFLNSASLLADAGHSLSDLLGDFVVLASWNTSRKPATSAYPYGYGKFETLGTTTVSLLLIGGALAIGFHSYHLLLSAVAPYISSIPPGAAADALGSVIEATQHAHRTAIADTSHVLDPNAAWFALASVVIKEWLFRVTKRVADKEGSSVLLANAYHHRSDAYSSVVALVAILGTWVGIPALDPIGGLVVSGLILQQGFGLLFTAFRELTDAGIEPGQRDSLAALMVPLVSTDVPRRLLAIRNVRAVRSGALLFVDLTADVPPDMTMREAHEVERTIRECLMKERKEIKEVRVHLHVEGVEEDSEQTGPPC